MPQTNEWAHERAIQFCCELDQCKSTNLSSSQLESFEWKIENIISEAQRRARKEMKEYILAHVYGGGNWRRVVEQYTDLDTVIHELKK